MAVDLTRVGVLTDWPNASVALVSQKKKKKHQKTSEVCLFISGASWDRALHGLLRERGWSLSGSSHQFHLTRHLSFGHFSSIWQKIREYLLPSSGGSSAYSSRCFTNRNGGVVCWTFLRKKLSSITFFISSIIYHSIRLFLNIQRCAEICDKLSQLGILESRPAIENPYILDDSPSNLETTVSSATTVSGWTDGAATSIKATTVAVEEDDMPPPLPFPRGASMKPPQQTENTYEEVWYHELRCL